MTEPLEDFVAVDIGNSRLKFGLFHAADITEFALPQPRAVLSLEPDGLAPLDAWAARFDAIPLPWFVSSVNRQSTAKFNEWHAGQADAGPARLLTASDFPLEVALERPDHVGDDRLAAAVAAIHLRDADRAAVIVALGTAIVVNLVDPAGRFVGGAILPGLEMSARALHEMTDMLPLWEVHDWQDPPPALGISTIDAMQAGLYWGAVGAIKQFVAEYAAGLDRPPQLFLTGGAGDAVSRQLGHAVHHEPHLTLCGVALTAETFQ